MTLPRIICLTLPRDDFDPKPPASCIRPSDATLAHFTERGVGARLKVL